MSKRSFVVAGSALALSLLVVVPAFAATTKAPKVKQHVPAPSFSSKITKSENDNAQKIAGSMGKVTAVNGNTITFAGRSGVVFSVDVTNAKITKGKDTATVSDIKVGNELIVHGAINNHSIVADSVQIIDLANAGTKKGPGESAKQHPQVMTTVGTVASLSGSSLTMNTVALGKTAATVTVNTDGNTIFRKGGKAAKPSDLAVGQHVIVKGAKDAASGVVTATEIEIVTKSVAPKFSSHSTTKPTKTKTKK